MERPAESPEKILLVEGKDDESVVGHIIGRTAAQLAFDICNKKGVKNVIPAIFGHIKAPHRRAVGIVVDANDNIQARWQSISDRLKKAGVQVPKSPDPAGTVISDTPRVGIWLMPDNVSSGELEDFVRCMIPNKDPVWPQSRQYIDQVAKSTGQIPSRKKLKAEIHAWLATRENPGLMGSAVAKGDLLIDGDLCQKFLAWLDRLFK